MTTTLPEAAPHQAATLPDGAVAVVLGTRPEIVKLAGVIRRLGPADRAMPEERNRVLADHFADLCCAPTEVNVAALRAEGVPAERIALTGNTVVEAVRETLAAAGDRAAILRGYRLAAGRFVLATIHRPENTDTAPVLGGILD